MNDEEMLARLDELKKLAWKDKDIEFVDFYLHVAQRLRELIVVGKAIGSLYNNTSDEHAWNAMYKALNDAGLVD